MFLFFDNIIVILCIIIIIRMNTMFHSIRHYPICSIICIIIITSRSIINSIRSISSRCRNTIISVVIVLFFVAIIQLPVANPATVPVQQRCMLEIE